MQLRKAANHELLLPGIAYSDDTLKEISVILHNDPSHSDADPALVLEDLCNLSDHQIHKVCRLYDVSFRCLWLLIIGNVKGVTRRHRIPKLIVHNPRISLICRN